MTTIRDMTKDDVEGVGVVLFDAFTAASERYRYAPRFRTREEALALAWAMFRYPAMDVLVAEAEGRVVGSCGLNLRGSNGGIGPVSIDPGFHGKGTGRELLAAATDRGSSLRSLRALQESFNPASFVMGYALGYLPVATVLELHRKGGSGPPPEPCDQIDVLTPADVDELADFDAPRSRFDRRVDLAHFARWGSILVYRSGSRIRGYLSCLAGSTGVQLGPLVADGTREAEALFKHAAGLFPERMLRACVMARDADLARSLFALRFKVYCLESVMVKGPWEPGGHIEAFSLFPECA